MLKVEELFCSANKETPYVAALLQLKHYKRQIPPVLQATSVMELLWSPLKPL